MFDFLKSKKSDPVEALTNQAIGGQSVMYRLFREGFACDDSSVRRLELTYFATAVMTFVYLRLGKQLNREQILDRFTRSVLEKSLPSSREQISFGTVVKEYQQRYAEYDGLLTLLFNPSESSSGNPATTLLMHVFECVTRTTARGNMIQIDAASGVVQQFVLDHIDLVKKKPRRPVLAMR